MRFITIPRSILRSIELSDDEIQEADLPGRFTDPFQLDDLAGERAGDKELVLVPADAAVAVDVAGLAPARRLRFEQLARIAAR